MAKAPTQIRSLARSHTEAAINVLTGVMNQTDAPPAARVQAATAVLDRGWGKPSQPISGDDDGSPISIQAIVRKIVDPQSGNSNGAGL